MDVRRATAEDWEELRDLRLRALEDSPDAFLSTLAEALARAVIEWARAEGVPRVVLWVVIGNAPAERFYERLGFRPTGVTARLRNGLDRELALDL